MSRGLAKEVLQQPQTLRKLADFYGQGEGAARLSSVPSSVAPVLTGMGASFHAARVVVVENGRTRSIAETVDERSTLDEFLSPILDVIPAQLFAEALAQRLGITPGFRYISPKS